MRLIQPWRLLAFVALAGCGLPGWSQQISRQPITFLELNDVHVTLADESTNYPSKVIEAMNRVGAAFTLVCGDLATDGKRGELEKAKAVLDRLARPYYVVAGNHDAQFAGIREETLFREVFGLKSNSYSFARDGIHFIALDPGIGSDYQNNTVRPDVMKWLSGVVSAIPDGDPVILFSHYPYGPGVTYRTKNAAEVLAMFRGKKLLAVISGHFHGNTERVENGILFTTTAGSSSTRDNHDRTKAKGYRIFRISPDLSVQTEFREVAP